MCGPCAFGEQPGGVNTLLLQIFQETLPCNDYLVRVAYTAVKDCFPGGTGVGPEGKAALNSLQIRCGRDEGDGAGVFNNTLPYEQCDHVPAASPYHTAVTSVVLILAGLIVVDVVPAAYFASANRDGKPLSFVLARAAILSLIMIVPFFPLQTSDQCYKGEMLTVASTLSEDTFIPDGATAWFKRWSAHLSMVLAAATCADLPHILSSGQHLGEAQLVTIMTLSFNFLSIAAAIVASASYGPALCPDMRPGPAVYIVLAISLCAPLAVRPLRRS